MAAKSMLMLAAENGHTSVASMLLRRLSTADKQQGTDIRTSTMLEKKNEDGFTALMIAAQHGHANIAEILLQYGASSSSVDGTGWTALMEACQNNHTRVVQLLLQSKADAMAMDRNGDNALMVACYHGHHEPAAQLLAITPADAAGIIDATNYVGYSPLLLAAQRGHAEVVQLLLTSSHEQTFSYSMPDGYNALHMACGNGHLRCARLLLQGAANRWSHEWEERQQAQLGPGEREEKVLWVQSRCVQWCEGVVGTGHCALHLAAGAGHTEVCHWLLEQRVNVGPVATGDGTTPLMIAAQNGQHACTLALLGEGASVATVDQRQWTALLYAAHQGHARLVQLLVGHGASVNYSAADGSTALVQACQQGHLATVSALLQAGASATQPMVDGGLAVHVAAYNGYYEVIRLLLQRTADKARGVSTDGIEPAAAGAGSETAAGGGESIFGTVGSPEEEFVLEQVQRHCNHPSCDGSSALIYAAERGQEQAIAVLLEYHADPNVENQMGYTPLNLVASLQPQQPEPAEHLDVEALEEAARKVSEDTALRLTTMMLDSGASMEHVNVHGGSALGAPIYDADGDGDGADGDSRSSAHAHTHVGGSSSMAGQWGSAGNGQVADGGAGMGDEGAGMGLNGAANARPPMMDVWKLAVKSGDTDMVKVLLRYHPQCEDGSNGTNGNSQAKPISENQNPNAQASAADSGGMLQKLNQRHVQLKQQLQELMEEDEDSGGAIDQGIGVDVDVDVHTITSDATTATVQAQAAAGEGHAIANEDWADAEASASTSTIMPMGAAAGASTPSVRGGDASFAVQKEADLVSTSTCRRSLSFTPAARDAHESESGSAETSSDRGGIFGCFNMFKERESAGSGGVRQKPRAGFFLR